MTESYLFNENERPTYAAPSLIRSRSAGDDEWQTHCDLCGGETDEHHTPEQCFEEGKKSAPDWVPIAPETMPDIGQLVFLGAADTDETVMVELSKKGDWLHYEYGIRVGRWATHWAPILEPAPLGAK